MKLVGPQLLIELHRITTGLGKRELISTGRYDEDIAKYIFGLLEHNFQGMLEDINTREKTANSSYTDIEQLYFQIQLTDNYYLIPNSVHICFPIKIKKNTNSAQDIDAGLSSDK